AERWGSGRRASVPEASGQGVEVSAWDHPVARGSLARKRRKSLAGAVTRQLRLSIGFDRSLDVCLGETGGKADGGGGLLSRIHVGGGNVDDAIGVDLERDLDLHLPPVTDAEAREFEFTEHFALPRFVGFALVDPDLHLLLPVPAGGEGLGPVNGDGRVFVD